MRLKGREKLGEEGEGLRKAPKPGWEEADLWPVILSVIMWKWLVQTLHKMGHSSVMSSPSHLSLDLSLVCFLHHPSLPHYCLSVLTLITPLHSYQIIYITIGGKCTQKILKCLFYT